MKKSKLSITLVTSFIAAMALTACNEVTSSKTALVTFTPYGSKETIDLITDDIYNAYRGTSNGVNKFYEKILEVLIRYEFKDKNCDKGEMKYAEIETWAKNQVQEQKDTAKANAKSNGTNYDDEWKAILESHSADDEKELREHFIYDKEKEVITNWYADDTDNAEGLKNEFLGVDKDNKPVDQSQVEVKAAMPYHIRHILVKVDEASEGKFYKGTISEAQAKLLADTVSTLASGKFTFSQVASMYSEDGSASSGGDVGIMTNTATSGSLGMVNEFQLGLYAYDNLYDAGNAASAGAANIKDGLGITDEVAAKLPAAAVEVPYGAFMKIGEVAKITADKEGNKLANGSATVYPRNILWNKYLNLHNVFVITNKTTGASSFGAVDHNTTVEFNNLVGADVYDASLPRFKNGVLVDENDNVIIGVRSEYGIHLMVIEKSMYDEKLADYYTTKLPGEEGYPAGETYVGYIQSQNIEDYKKRADDIKSKITSFDATYDYRLYQYLLDEIGTITYTGAAEGLGEQIDSYISATKENNAFKQEDGLKKVWRTYTELLGIQEENRNAKFDTVNAKGQVQSDLTRLVSEKIADDFIMLYTGKNPDGTDAAAADILDAYKNFGEEGDYYYYA